uniref:Uncharacterized protein n=1 Tax=Pelusios castaneus TaxID=367368 RepID=A0A8C8VN99_9SAUR
MLTPAKPCGLGSPLSSGPHWAHLRAACDSSELPVASCQSVKGKHTLDSRPAPPPPPVVGLHAALSSSCALPMARGTANGPPAFGSDSQPRHRRLSGRGEWTPWGGWSACSSTCGDGASFRTRKCIRSAHQALCDPGSSVLPQGLDMGHLSSFLQGQCWDGAQGQVGTTPPAPNLCDLNCLAVGYNFYYTFGRVLDGTRCSPDSQDLCISGQCLVGLSGAGPGALGRPAGGRGVPKGSMPPWQRGMQDKVLSCPCIQGVCSASTGPTDRPVLAGARQGYLA